MAIKTLNKLVVPKEPDIIYTYPAIVTWPVCVLINSNILANTSSITEYRRELLSLASAYTEQITGERISYDDKKPIVASGHQPNWHHCGVFIKSNIGYILAKKMNAVFVHIVLDHDTCKTALLMPSDNSDAPLSNIDISPGTGSHIPLEKIYLSPDSLSKCKDTLMKVTQSIPDNALCNIPWATFLSNNRLSEYKTVADLITSLLAVSYTAAGIKALYLPVSLIAQSSSFMAFIVRLFLDQENFINSYNRAIPLNNGNIDIHHLDTKPFASCSQKEFPLWIINPEGERHSLYISLDCHNQMTLFSNSNVALSINIENIHLIFDHLAHNGYALRPKAILLSLFLRLYLSDLFIHGVGGARYDVITDYLLNKYFNIKDLQFGVATMTSYLYGSEYAACISILNDLSQKNRLFLSNPEQLLSHTQADIPEIKTLIDKKRQLISLSTDSTQCSQTKKDAWNTINSVNNRIQQYIPKTYESLDARIQTLKEKSQHYHNRELYFGFYPKKYLLNLSKEIKDGLK